jgi:hypothetical protein
MLESMDAVNKNDKLLAKESEVMELEDELEDNAKEVIKLIESLGIRLQLRLFELSKDEILQITMGITNIADDIAPYIDYGKQLKDEQKVQLVIKSIKKKLEATQNRHKNPRTNPYNYNSEKGLIFNAAIEAWNDGNNELIRDWLITYEIMTAHEFKNYEKANKFKL